ncbi:MAG: GNAT family N-acetyltransferase [Bacteroidetes bacterium]|nr:GNAT family N-acetyltransferase [Bacteroidota bacterium]
MKNAITIIKVTSDYTPVVLLFREYAAWLDFDLCFQDFEKELENLPGYYSPPGGIFLAYSGEESAGCVALRKIDAGTCEMKRLFVREKYRGMKIGRLLSEKVIQAAKENGFKTMKLDTLERMKEAVSLYKSMGFVISPPYRENPMPDVIYMELPLA